MKSRHLGMLFAAALALLPFGGTAHAAASSQTTHAYLCAQQAAGTGPYNRRVVNPNTSNAYSLNGQGCALIANADIGWALSQGYTYGPNIFTLQTVAFSPSTTSSTTGLVLPGYAYIVAVIVAETSGNELTDGWELGDSGSATAYTTGAACATQAANATCAAADSVLQRINATTNGISNDTLYWKCVTTCNSSSAVNITVLYSYW